MIGNDMAAHDRTLGFVSVRDKEEDLAGGRILYIHQARELGIVTLPT